jgi:hypothetical protein
MTGESNPMAEFFRKIGQHTIYSKSSWWYEVQPKVLLSFPYYKLIEPGEDEINELFRQHKLRAIRYPAPINAFGFPSSLELNTDPSYDLSRLEREARRQTRQGLANCKFEQIDFDFLAEHGLALNRDTAERQGRETIYTDPKYWGKYCEAGKGTPGITAWGVFAEGKLGTFLVAAEFEDWWNWLLTHSSTALLKKRPSNVLFYEATRQFFQNNPGKKICYGLGSLESVSALDSFKLNMGITMQPIKQRIVFSKTMRCLFSPAQEPCLRVLNKIFPKSYTIRKACAMIRLYRRQSYDVPVIESSESDEPQ